MSGGSVVDKIFKSPTQIISSAARGDIGGVVEGNIGLLDPWNLHGKLEDELFKKDGKAPSILPDAPNPADATNAALDAQLKNELNIRRSMALVTGGQGVYGQPSISTAGQSLVGS